MPRLTLRGVALVDSACRAGFLSSLKFPLCEATSTLTATQPSHCSRNRREIALVPETRAGIGSAPQVPHRPAPRTRAASAVNRSRCRALENTSPSISGLTRTRLMKRRDPSDFSRSRSWRARPSDVRCLQEIPITTKSPISTKKVSAMIATVRNTSLTGTGVMARLALRSPGAQSQTLSERGPGDWRRLWQGRDGPSSDRRALGAQNGIRAASCRSSRTTGRASHQAD